MESVCGKLEQQLKTVSVGVTGVQAGASLMAKILA
jgi:hypothetical protein